jgi:hypothetical protein
MRLIWGLWFGLAVAAYAIIGGLQALVDVSMAMTP